MRRFSLPAGGVACCLLLCFLTAGHPAACSAAPPFSEVIVLEQPDGTSFSALPKVRKGGKSWMETTDGYPVVQDTSGYWLYALFSGDDLVSTNAVVGLNDPVMEDIPKSPFSVRPFARNPAFWKLGRWKCVDRMGLLEKPRVPMAWKGGDPRAAWLWTGTEWLFVPAENGKPLSAALRKRAETIESLLSAAVRNWESADDNNLRAVAEEWGFAWMGVVKNR